jgi:hypothetical protein
MGGSKFPSPIFGPFAVAGAKVADKEYQKTFWTECDGEYPQLSEANGLYLFSLRNGSNYEPNYVGMTKREFRKEVFNPPNVVKILNCFVPKRGELCVHLLAKPRDSKVGFSTITKKTLLWSEMFLLLLCRKKNPEILNIVGHTFLENCGMEGVTTRGWGKSIKTFRNALGIDSFGMGAGTVRNKPITQPTAKPIIQPTAAKPTAKPTANPTTQPITQPTATMQPFIGE